MKKTVLFVALFISATLINSAFAQKVKLIDGSLASLKGESEMNIQYDYSQMGVGKFDKEEDYIKKKKEEYNSKDEGKGEKWEADWIKDRKDRFEPNFEELFNKYGKAKVGNYPNAKYTMILKTTFTEPGFNVHVMRKNAMINAEAWIVETSNPKNVVAKISIQKSPGRTFGGYDYDTGVRIQESYAAAGKALGKFMK